MIAVRQQHGVAVAHDVGDAFTVRRVLHLMAEALRRIDAVVVNLLEYRLAVLSVVLVRRIAAPVAGWIERLAGHHSRRPIENVVIRNCEMRDGHGGVVIGSEISGGARNIFAEQCRMDSPRLDRVLRFKTNAARGGTIERVAIRNITVGQVAEAIVAADFYYEEGDTGGVTPGPGGGHVP